MTKTEIRDAYLNNGKVYYSCDLRSLHQSIILIQNVRHKEAHSQTSRPHEHTIKSLTCPTRCAISLLSWLMAARLSSVARTDLSNVSLATAIRNRFSSYTKFHTYHGFKPLVDLPLISATTIKLLKAISVFMQSGIHFVCRVLRPVSFCFGNVQQHTEVSAVKVNQAGSLIGV